LLNDHVASDLLSINFYRQAQALFLKGSKIIPGRYIDVFDMYGVKRDDQRLVFN